MVTPPGAMPVQKATLRLLRLWSWFLDLDFSVNYGICHDNLPGSTNSFSWGAVLLWSVSSFNENMSDLALPEQTWKIRSGDYWAGVGCLYLEVCNGFINNFLFSVSQNARKLMRTFFSWCQRITDLQNQDASRRRFPFPLVYCFLELHVFVLILM